jgi:SAM-dependent methyltransferase
MPISSNTKKYTSVNPLLRLAVKNFLRTISGLLEGLPARRILDAGCGEGYVLPVFLQNYPHSLIIGTDNRIEALVSARLKNPQAGFAGADILRLPFKERVFDVVACSEVIEHITQYHEALKELRRVTAGYCVITVPYEPFFSIFRFLSGKNVLRGGKHPEHVNRFTKEEIIRELSVYFTIEKIVTAFPWLIIVCKA